MELSYKKELETGWKMKNFIENVMGFVFFVGFSEQTRNKYKKIAYRRMSKRVNDCLIVVSFDLVFFFWFIWESNSPLLILSILVIL